MSNFRAIATVTATLKRLVHEAAVAAVGGASTTTLRMEAGATGLPTTGVNIFLYQVSPNTALRNTDLPTRTSSGAQASRPRLALDLHYLLTFFASSGELDTQLLMGNVAATLHARPIITHEMIQAAIAADGGDPDTAFLTSTDLQDEVERVKLSPVGLSLEELSKLWSVLIQVPYRLSLAYMASVVLIEAPSTPRVPRQVLEPVIQIEPTVTQDEAGVDPDALDDLMLWLRADRGVTHDEDGVVSAWADQSGNGYHAVQGTAASRPVLVRGILNGRPALRFDGSDDRLAITGKSFAAAGALGGLTVFALVRSSASSAQSVVGWDGAAYFELALEDAAHRVAFTTTDSVDTTHSQRSAAARTNGDWHTLEAVFDRTSVTADKVLAIDGATDASGLHHAGAGLGASAGVTRFGYVAVGSAAATEGGAVTAGTAFHGEIAEIIVFERALTAAERDSIRAGLAARYR